MRFMGLSIFLSALVTALLAAADGEPKKPAKEADAKEAKAEKDVKGEPKKKGEAEEAKEEKKAPAEEKGGGMGDGGGEDKVKKLLERLDQNFDDATQRLDKKDASKDTVKLQEDILADIDELLKQKNKSNSGGGGGGGGASSSSKSSSSKSGGQSSQQKSSDQSQAKNQGNAGQKNGQGQNDQKNGGQGQANKQGGNDQKKEAGGQAKNQGNEQKKDEKTAKQSGTGGDVSKTNAKDTNKNADLKKDVWGHLNKRKMQEMDAFSREKFMPQYEELLRQYYRTIAESRRKDGE